MTKPATSAAVVTTTETSVASAPPPYPGTYPVQPQAVPAPYPQANYFLYPTGGQAAPPPAPAAPKPFPDLDEKPPPGQVELHSAAVSSSSCSWSDG